MDQNSGRVWPEGFIWGTGSSSTQSEGAAQQSDWYAWERTGHAPLSGEGNGFSTRFAEDFALLSQHSLRHYRLSVEWARIEPEEGTHDQAALDHYRQMLLCAREHGIEIWICLHHFSLPEWFARAGGFLNPDNRLRYWARHVDFIAKTFGDLVSGWQPVNETNYYPTAAFLGRGWPPGHNDIGEWSIASQQIQLASAEAAVRLKRTGHPVASIFGLGTLHLLDESDQSKEFAEFFYAANWSAGLKLFRDGELHIPGMEPQSHPELAGAFDLIGFSFYCTFGVEQGKLVPYPPTAPQSPLEYAIWPEGLGLVLDRLHQEVPDTPLLIAEYGIGTADDSEREDYLERGLEITYQALQKGMDIRGFLHWTAVDNYEWLHGFDVQFGLIDSARRPKKSIGILAREARKTVSRHTR
jgi:beta-glucosidase